MFFKKRVCNNIYSQDYKDKKFKIYFGHASDNILKDKLVALSQEKDICEIDNFACIKKNIGFKKLLFLNQVHGSSGLLINDSLVENTSEKDKSCHFLEIFESVYEGKFLKSFQKDGDFLVTNVKGLAIGVLTADCLPIVFIDKENAVVAVSHAGWRGSVENIACKTVQSMQASFDSKLEDIQVFFGPSIKQCCYQVGNDFEKNLSGYDFAEQVLHKGANDSSSKEMGCVRLNKGGQGDKESKNSVYFDLPKFNFLLLQQYGIPKENIDFGYNFCTCCDKRYCSYRRGDIEARQATIVCFV